MATLKRYLPVILWCLVIFSLSSLETTPTPQDTLLNFLIKKTAHVVEYAILYWLTFRALNYPQRFINQRSRYRAPKTRHLYPLVFTLFYAVSDEIHQSFVPGRHARLYDIGFDALGALTAISLINRKINDRKPPRLDY